MWCLKTVDEKEALSRSPPPLKNVVIKKEDAAFLFPRKEVKRQPPKKK